MSQEHKEKIIEACFDWLIRDEKIAVKVYSMNSLYFLGTEFDWIHPELVQILEKNYPTGSKGYQARSRSIFDRIKK